MNPKETYKQWIEYCTLAADDITTLIDQAYEHAAGSAWIHSGATLCPWQLVYAVRDWEPDLFDDASVEVGQATNLEDHIRDVAFAMTRTKIEHKLQEKQ